MTPIRRVLVLTQYYAPETGAAPIRPRATVRELRRLGVEVRVLTGLPSYPTGRIHAVEATRLRHRRDVVFLMVGDGPVRAPLVDEVTRRQLDNSIVHPLVPIERIPALMSIFWASLVVLRRLRIATSGLPRRCRRWPAGLTVLFVAWGETAEIFEREHVGLVVEPDAPEALAAAIERLADDADGRAAMAI